MKKYSLWIFIPSPCFENVLFFKSSISRLLRPHLSCQEYKKEYTWDAKILPQDRHPTKFHHTHLQNGIQNTLVGSNTLTRLFNHITLRLHRSKRTHFQRQSKMPRWFRLHQVFQILIVHILESNSDFETIFQCSCSNGFNEFGFIRSKS